MAKSGMIVSWGMEHKDKNDRLISRAVMIQAPEVPQCGTVKCLLKYLRASLLYALVVTYHRRRITYAEMNRNKVILERYRTGDPSPKTIWQAIHANIKLTCPVCRKFNVDPLLGSRELSNGTN